MSFQPPSSPSSRQRGESSGGLRRPAFIEIPGYEIECEIGRGGMATVYLAVQQSLGRRVALKVLALEVDADNDFSQRFKKEGRILAQLVHPNIVTIYDIGATDENCFFSMEYLPGDTLKQRIKQGLSLDSAIQITRSMAKALGYAHERGVVHRDVKPFNILFRQDDTPVLTDFGVARVAESKTINTMVGLTIGSPGYMSPEQAKGEIATIQSDLYSLGVVIYEMFAGRPPYEADNSIAITLKHLHDPIPKLPKEYSYLQPVINKLLAKKSSDRYKNTSEFLKAFDAIVPGNDTGSLPGINTDISSVSIAEFTNGKLRALLDTDRKRLFSVLGIVVAIIVVVAVYNFKIKNPGQVVEVSEQTQPVEQPEQMRPKQDTTALLKRAESQLQAKLLSGDSDDSAESIYRRVLKLEPGNAEALMGLQNIAKEYEKQAQQRLDAGTLQEGLNFVNQGLAIAPAHEGLMRLRREIERRFAEIKAERMRQEEQRQRELQAEQFLMQAQSSFQEGTLEITLAHIEQGLLAIPDHRDLLALRERVRARLVEQQRQAEARRRQEEEARRQAELAERQKAEQARQQAEAARRLQEAERYWARALDDQRNGLYADGLQQIEKGLALAPDHAGLMRLREEVRVQLAAEQKRQAEQAKREQEITALLRQADAQWKAKRLTEPAGNNAEATYRRILALDAGNAQAQAGLERIAQEYLQQARQRQSAGAFQESLKQIDKGLSVVPNQAELLRLRDEVRVQFAAEQQKLEQQRFEQQQRETQRQEQEQQKKLEQQQEIQRQREEKPQQEEQQRQEQQKKQEQQKRQQDQQRREQQRLEQQRQEQQRQEQQKKLEQQRQEERQRQDQQRREQQRLEQQRQEQQNKFEQQRQEEKRRQEEQRRQEQQKRIEQQRLEQQRREQQRQEQQPPKQPQPEKTTKPRVFGTF